MSAYLNLAQQLYPRVVDKIVSRNEISPNEANWLLQQLNGAAFNNFVADVTARYPSLQGEAQLEQMIYYQLVQPMINNYRRQMAGGYGGGGYGPQPYVGGGGYYPPQPPNRGGAWYTGGGAPGNPGYVRGPRGYGVQPPPPPPQRPAPRPRREKENEAPAKPKVPWKAPEVDVASKVNHTFDNSTAFAMERYTGADGTLITNAFVINTRPRFSSGMEAIEMYKHIFDDCRDGRQILTVCYNEMHVIRTDRAEFKKLVKDVSAAVSNIGADNIKDRVRAILNISKDHMAVAKEAFEKLVVDEFNYHVRCGELTDSDPNHATWSVTANSLQGLADLISGDISKETRDTLHKIHDFDKRLETIVSRVIDTVVLNADKRILDPVADKSIMDIYGHAVPPVWRNNRENCWKVTDNFFSKFLASQKTINGSQPQTAIVAAQSLQTELTTTDRNYTVLLMPRIIMWSNSPASDVVPVDRDGTYGVAVYGEKHPMDNDIAYFANTVFTRTNNSNVTAFAIVPHRIICESDGVMVRLNFGMTSDRCMYVGPGKIN